MLLLQLAALSSSFLFALGDMIGAGVSREIGGPRFVRIRMVVVSIIMVLAVGLFGDWQTIKVSHLGLIVVSSLTGIVIGDAALFTGIFKIGARRTLLIFTLYAPITAILSYFILNEDFDHNKIAGTILVTIGVMCVVLFDIDDSESPMEVVVGSMLAGIIWVLIAALTQAIGFVALKPVIDDDAGLFEISSLRVALAVPVLWFMARPFDFVAGTREITDSITLTDKQAYLTFVSGLLTTVLGTSLVIYASQGEQGVGIATVLSSISPIFLPPLIWFFAKKRPPIGTWVGSILCIIGIALVFVEPSELNLPFLNFME